MGSLEGISLAVTAKQVASCPAGVVEYQVPDRLLLTTFNFNAVTDKSAYEHVEFDLSKVSICTSRTPDKTQVIVPTKRVQEKAEIKNDGDFTLSWRELAPSAGTWAHLTCGVLGVFAAISKADPALVAGLVFGAYVFDLVDGLMARKLYKEIPAERKALLGKYGDALDGACDSVSFGLAPVALFYSSFLSQATGVASVLGWAAAIGYPMAITYRLARYSLIHTQGIYFKGLFSPAGGVVATTAIALLSSLGASNSLGTLLATATFATLSILHASAVPYPHSKAWKGELKNQFRLLVGAGLSTSAIALAAGMEVKSAILCGLMTYWGSFLASPLLNRNTKKSEVLNNIK